ncbi:MAG: PPC domain-containing protein [Verrucomicrobiales bacterium]|nr:PPC domain-containing protein [Verrucomicrobiales bacterium]
MRGEKPKGHPGMHGSGVLVPLRGNGRIGRNVFLGALACGLGVAAHAQPVPRLVSSPVTWFQRGTTNEVVLTGEALSGVQSIWVTGEGVSVSPGNLPAPAVSLEGSAGGLSAAPEASKTLPVRVVIVPGAPLGTRELRVAGPDGVSNPLTLNISDLPERLEPPSGAPPLAHPVAVSGMIGAGAETDTFRVAAHAGERVIVDVQANRLGSPLDPTLVIRDSSGKELARSEDVHGLDPFLEFAVPADGEYAVQISDARYQGGGDYRYRTVVGVLPYLDFLFPFGGRRSAVVDVEMEGLNLEGAGRMTLQVAPDAPMGRQDIRAHTARGLSNPQPFEAGDLPEVRETEPNNVADKATSYTAPLVINGKLADAGDVDVFKIVSASDQKLAIEVKARRFGSPLDAFLTLMDDQGKVLQRNDDASGPDARIEFDAKKDATYLISLRDLTDRGGARFGYRMSVQSPDRTPDFTVRSSASRIRVPRSGQVAVRCEVDRRNGFDGIVRVVADSLPTGVSAGPLTLGGGSGFGWLVLSTSEEAPLGNVPLRLTAIGEREGRAVTHPVSLPESGWLTILPSAPFSVAVAPAAVMAEQNGAVELDVSVVRRAGFDGSVRVLAEDLPGVAIPAVTIPPDQSRARVALRPNYNAEVGLRPVMIRAESGEGAQIRSTHAPAPVSLTTQGIPMFLTAMLPGSPFFRTDSFRLSAVALPTNSASAANVTEFVVKVDRRGLAGEIALSLVDLPPGVTAVVAAIPSDKNEATIRLTVSDAAEAGKEFKFAVVATASHNDRLWRQKTQPITLYVSAPEKQTASAASAVPGK